MDKTEAVFTAICITFVITFYGVLLLSGAFNGDLQVDQEVANDICFQLTGNKSAEASMEQGKLVCELPSYDATQNIIVRTNNEKK